LYISLYQKIRTIGSWTLQFLWSVCWFEIINYQSSFWRLSITIF